MTHVPKHTTCGLLDVSRTESGERRKCPSRTRSWRASSPGRSRVWAAGAGRRLTEGALLSRRWAALTLGGTRGLMPAPARGLLGRARRAGQRWEKGHGGAKMSAAVTAIVCGGRSWTLSRAAMT